MADEVPEENGGGTGRGRNGVELIPPNPADPPEPAIAIEEPIELGDPAGQPA